ncbi:ATP-grasp domain-containing protein [Streptacidiphilus sp. P02-A3a]|uniref:ATP-grasp domain-containing protein n=1 Tax=Streptacidiphilus sp. P02-A3a TaxID=2704468 RepID=UPI0015F7EA2A|nr:ATP-grasp domain-containing protein [Streptacidiphilus sp. P02-A3a]QMU71448.1 ATP-grasp domain-containing protein [Streptacidiphilus sp. P02-A3a]
MTTDLRDARAGRVLVVEPMSSGTALLGAAHDLGLETVVLSHDRDDRRLPDRLRKDIDTLVVLDTNDEPALLEAAVRLHRQRGFAGVLPGFEFYVPAAARVAARLGLPGLAAASVEEVRDKELMRRHVASAGLRTPRFAAVAAAAELPAAAAEVGFPCVLKPTDSAGSIHVSRVESLDQLKNAYQRLTHDQRLDLGRGLDGRVLLEEYLDGPEVSVEGYVAAGRVTVVAVTRKLLGPEPYFVELGHVVQAELEPAVRRAVEAYAAAVVAALHVTVGPFHCELRLPGGEPVLIELGARMGGDRIPDLVGIATGVPLAHLAVAAHTGLDPQEVPLGSPRAKYAGIHFFTAPGPGGYRAVHGLERLRARPEVLEAELHLPPGRAVPAAHDFRGRIGHVLYATDSYADALELRRTIDLGVTFD